GRPMNALDSAKYTAMQNGYATSSRIRMKAGETKSGPRMVSRSSSSLTRARHESRAVAVTGRVTMATSGLARHDLFHLVLRPRDRVLRGGTRHRLRDHVGHDERVGDELDLVARRRGPAVRVVLRALVLEIDVLRIGLQHRVVLQVRVDRQVEGGAGHDVLVVHLALTEEVTDPLLGRLDVLRELPDAD